MHRLKLRPSELSASQAQRVLITITFLHWPTLQVADEANRAQRMIMQSELLPLFSNLNRELWMPILFDSHGLLAIASLCHRIMILKEDEVVESGSTKTILHSHEHQYTHKLIEYFPRILQEPEVAERSLTN